LRTLISGKGTYPRNSWSVTLLRRNDISGLCFILDAGSLEIDIEEAAHRALRAGVRLFQYRSKEDSRRTAYETAHRLSQLLHSAGALFIVNDHADIAMAVDADGVHLGQEDLPVAEARRVIGPERLIGVSTHGPEQARSAEADGADYIGFGPVFPTATKDAGPLRGLDGLREVRRASALPLIAIGGIGPMNAAEVIAAGADGVAVIGAIARTPDIEEAARTVMAQVQEGLHRRS
jgi:thiamine-phosphate pyrophosphorylase